MTSSPTNRDELVDAIELAIPDHLAGALAGLYGSDQRDTDLLAYAGLMRLIGREFPDRDTTLFDTLADLALDTWLALGSGQPRPTLEGRVRDLLTTVDHDGSGEPWRPHIQVIEGTGNHAGQYGIAVVVDGYFADRETAEEIIDGWRWRERLAAVVRTVGRRSNTRDTWR